MKPTQPPIHIANEASIHIEKPPRSIGHTLLGTSIVVVSLLVLNLYLWLIATHTGKGNPFDYQWTQGLTQWAFEDAFGRPDMLVLHGAALLAIWALVAGLVMAIRGYKRVKPSA